MLTRKLIASVPKILKRNVGITAPMLATASDPIQQLFLDKLKEYKTKNPGGKVTDTTPEYEKQKKTELDRLAQQFGGLGDKKTMSEFPKFSFQEPQVDIPTYDLPQGAAEEDDQVEQLLGVSREELLARKRK